MPVRTTKHKVSISCWSNPECRARFIDQYEKLGESFLYVEPIASNPHYQWAVFEMPG